MIASPVHGPIASYLLVPLVGLLGLVRPRLGYATAVIGLAVWFAAEGLGGVALILAALGLPPMLLIEGAGTRLVLPSLAPALGAVGLGPLYLPLAGITGKARERVVLGALGYAWLATAEVLLDRKLLFGSGLTPPDGWQHSAATTLRELVFPLLVSPGFLFGIAIWALAAFSLGVLVRGRSAALGLLGTVVWGAALIAALRLRAGALAPSPGILAAAALGIVAATFAWRGRSTEPSPSRRLEPVEAAARAGGRGAPLP
jgi:hypothetical protein